MLLSTVAAALVIICFSANNNVVVVDAFSGGGSSVNRRRHSFCSSSSDIHHRQRELHVMHQQVSRTNDNDEAKVTTTRRELLFEASSSSSSILAGMLLATTTGGAMPFEATAKDDNDMQNKPICVIGANGRTGQECVQACLNRNIPVKATSRSGMYKNAGMTAASSGSLSEAVCDVTNPDTVVSAVQSTRAVIFAASASKQGGTAAQVDNVGLVTVAKACLEAKVPHLVIVSSGGVSKPDSPVYKFLNIFGNIMAEKIQGEDAVRALYKGQKPVYTIVRPGGLTEEPGLGVAALELNQGDTKSGRISRTDVAALCVEATLYPTLTGDTTFECYNADTGKPLSSVGMSNIMKQTTTEKDAVLSSGKERRGNSFQEIFTGLEMD